MILSLFLRDSNKNLNKAKLSLPGYFFGTHLDTKRDCIRNNEVTTIKRILFTLATSQFDYFLDNEYNAGVATLHKVEGHLLGLWTD